MYFFYLGEFELQARVINKPYDVFGTWYNDNYLLSGNLHLTGPLQSCSSIILNKVRINLKIIYTNIIFHSRCFGNHEYCTVDDDISPMFDS